MPLTQLYLRTNKKPTPPDYDKKREKWLNFNKGIIALSKLGGIINDVNEFTNGRHVMLKSQGQKPIDSIEKNISTLKELFRKKQEAYLEADELYRKNLMELAKKDRQLNVDLQKALAKEYGLDTTYNYANMTLREMAQAAGGKRAANSTAVPVYVKGYTKYFPNKNAADSAKKHLMSTLLNDFEFQKSMFAQFVNTFGYDLDGFDLSKLSEGTKEEQAAQLSMLISKCNDQYTGRNAFHDYMKEQVDNESLLDSVSKINTPSVNRIVEQVMELPEGSVAGGGAYGELLVESLSRLAYKAAEETGDYAYANELIKKVGNYDLSNADSMKEIESIHDALAKQVGARVWKDVKKDKRVREYLRYPYVTDRENNVYDVETTKSDRAMPYPYYEENPEYTGEEDESYDIEGTMEE